MSKDKKPSASRAPVAATDNSTAEQIEIVLTALRKGLNSIPGSRTIGEIVKRQIDEMALKGNSGDEAAFETLFWTAYWSAEALSSQIDLERLRVRARTIPLWPVLDAPYHGVRKENDKFLRSIELGEDDKDHDIRRAYNRETVGRKWAKALIGMIMLIRAQLGRANSKSPEEAKIKGVNFRGTVVHISPELIRACGNLNLRTSPKDSLRNWKKAVRLALEAYQEKYHEIPELRNLVIASTKRRANARHFEQGSVEEKNLLRGDILTKIYDGVRAIHKANKL